MLRPDAQEDELVFICPGGSEGIPAISRDTAQDYLLHHRGPAGSICSGELAPGLVVGGNARTVSFLLGGMRFSRHLPIPSRALRFPADYQGIQGRPGAVAVGCCQGANLAGRQE